MKDTMRSTIRDAQYVRNRGLITQTEQARLANTTVAIGGTGGDGGELALILARLGFGRFVLADPEVFSAENLNRQAGCTVENLGRNKAAVIKEEILKINPDADVVVFSEGLTPTNINDFLEGVDVVCDEMEYTMHELAVMLARACRERMIPNFMALNVAWGCQITSFMSQGMTVEEFLGLDVDASLAEIAASDVPLDRWVRRVPNYIEPELLARVASGQVSAPSVAPGVALAAGALAAQLFMHVTERKPAVAAPWVYVIDAYECVSELIDTRI